FCIIWGLGIAAAMVAGGQWFAVMFTDDPAVVAQFSLYLHIAAWGYAGFGVLIIANGILNAVDKAPYALWQSALRVFGVMLPAAWLLVASWGSAAIYSAELAANLFGGLSGAVLIYWVLKRRAPDAG
ncbi:MAG: MATE family efflux transporter, partial [Erythrobacter sp.]|nr:MATE family efflux transporter [Erythrobacter sp.]